MKRKKSMQCYAASCWCDFGDLRQSEVVVLSVLFKCTCIAQGSFIQHYIK